MEPSIQVVLAYLLDLLIGDPAVIPHPVRFWGKIISWWEREVMPRVTKPYLQKIGGLTFTLAMLLAAYHSTLLVIWLASNISKILYLLVSIYLISTTLATRELQNTAKKLKLLLAEGKICQARNKLKELVGRDTERLKRKDLVRAVVESVAENTVDGIIAPLFYAFLGGAPLAMLYKIANTLDSMLGYRREPYLYWGWASARIDDLLNYLPARIMFFLMPTAALLSGKDAKKCFATMWRDRSKHPSPNSGIPEAAMAGALEIQLGGFNFYQGQKEFRPYLGKAIRKPTPFVIAESIKILNITAFLMVLLGLFIYMIT